MAFPGRFRHHLKPTFLGAPKQRREVFGTHSNTAHAWAQQSINHGRSSDGRMFWQGATIYSYGSHYAIAAFTDGVLDGKQVVLFNSEKYSVSTGQHHSEALSALRGLDVTTMTVPYVDQSMGSRHGANAQWLLDQFQAKAKEMANPRKNLWYIDAREDEAGTVNPTLIVERRVAALPGLLDTLRDYRRAFGDFSSSLAQVLAPDLDALVLEHAAAIREAFAKYEAGAPKREKAAAKRAARTMLADAGLRARAHAFIEGAGPPLIPNDWDRLQRWRKWRAPTDDRRLVERYLAAYQSAYPSPHARKRLTREQWWDGEGPATAWTTYPALSHYADTLCRRVAERLETSRGAVVPWRHAVAVFKRAQRCRANAQAWSANGETYQLGHFKLDHIGIDGTIKAGCHTIGWDEMLRLAVREIPQEVRPTYPLPVPTGG